MNTDNTDWILNPSEATSETLPNTSINDQTAPVVAPVESPSQLNGPLQEAFLANEQSETPFPHTDFMLDYSSFAASVATYDVECGNILNYAL